MNALKYIPKVDDQLRENICFLIYLELCQQKHCVSLPGKYQFKKAPGKDNLNRFPSV